MKKHQIGIFLILLIFNASCNENSEKNISNKEIEVFEPKVNLNELSDFDVWWPYHYYNISLVSNFTGINEQSEPIDKKLFLDNLITGYYIPLKLKSNDGLEKYKLFKLDTLADESIINTIKYESSLSLKYFNMEGQPFPKFDFTDINSNRYTSENTIGKTLILKTWFIACSACVAEFPELNKLVKKYKHSDEVVFLSLALDDKPKLESFLNRKAFDYDVVPNQNEFIYKALKSNSFPMHLVIDKNGIILKVATKASELISFLDNEEKLIGKKIQPIEAM